MRKITAMFATAVFVMTGCSQNEVMEEVAQNQPLEFGTYAGRPAQSRAGTETPNATVGTFGVFGYYTAVQDWSTSSTANFMDNQKVEWNTEKNAYVYDPLKYWPNTPDHKVSFWAYSPWKASTHLTKDASDTEGKTLILDNFTVPSTVKEHTDLLYTKDAQETFNLKKQKINDMVTFHFAHALARIGFSVEYAADEITPGTNKLDKNTKITINSVTLATENATKFYDSAKLKLKIAEKEGNKIFEPEWYDWTQNITSFTLNASETASDFKNNVLTKDIQKIDQLNADDSYIMILPQNITSKLKITVNYTVTTTNIGSNSNQSDEFSIINEVSNLTKNGIDFTMGKAYTFNLILGMTSVKVDAEIDTWDMTTTTIDVNLPENLN